MFKILLRKSIFILEGCIYTGWYLLFVCGWFGFFGGFFWGGLGGRGGVIQPLFFTHLSHGDDLKCSGQKDLINFFTLISKKKMLQRKFYLETRNSLKLRKKCMDRVW